MSLNVLWSSADVCRPKDVGQPKATVAAEFVMKRVPGVNVTPSVPTCLRGSLTHRKLRYFGKIQDKNDDYYMQFNLVICGLDSVEARRWMNATLVNLVDPENPESLKPLIDGGTEGELSSIGERRNSTESCRLYRFQRSGTRHSSHRIVLLRMLSGHAQQTHRIPHLHNCQHASSSGTLYRMGFRLGMASCLERLLT